MANPKASDKRDGEPDTSDYSATKAPENQPHVESEVRSAPAQRPGGAHGTPADVGMSGLHREDVPSLAAEDQAEDDADPKPPPRAPQP